MHCILVLDAALQAKQEWQKVSEAYVTKLLTLLAASTLAAAGELQVATVEFCYPSLFHCNPIQNVTAFRPVSQFLPQCTTSIFSNSKGKQKEVATCCDAPILDALVAALELFESASLPPETPKHVILVTSSDVSDSQFEGSLAGRLPCLTNQNPMFDQTTWPQLVQHFQDRSIQFSLITTCFLPQIEAIQKQIAKNPTPPPSVISLLDPEHAISLSGFPMQTFKQPLKPSVFSTSTDSPKALKRSLDDVSPLMDQQNPAAKRFKQADPNKRTSPSPTHGLGIDSIPTTNMIDMNTIDQLQQRVTGPSATAPNLDLADLSFSNPTQLMQSFQAVLSTGEQQLKAGKITEAEFKRYRDRLAANMHQRLLGMHSSSSPAWNEGNSQSDVNGNARTPQQPLANNVQDQKPKDVGTSPQLQPSALNSNLCWQGRLYKVLHGPQQQRMELQIHCAAHSLKPQAAAEIAAAKWPAVLDIANLLTIDLQALMVFTKQTNLPIAQILPLSAQQLPMGTDAAHHEKLYHMFVASLKGKAVWIRTGTVRNHGIMIISPTSKQNSAAPPLIALDFHRVAVPDVFFQRSPRPGAPGSIELPPNHMQQAQQAQQAAQQQQMLQQSNQLAQRQQQYHQQEQQAQMRLQQQQRQAMQQQQQQQLLTQVPLQMQQPQQQYSPMDPAQMLAAYQQSLNQMPTVSMMQSAQS